MTLAEARAKAIEAARMRANGIDPMAERKRQKAAQQILKAKPITFSQVAYDVIESRRPSWKNAKHAQQWESTLEMYVYPTIGNKPVCDVDTPDILKILKPIWNEKPETASRVRNRIEMVLDAAKSLKYRTGDNPAEWHGHLDTLLTPRKKTKNHHAALPFEQMPLFMTELQRTDTTTAKALQFLILTATRTSEAAHATWDEIDLEAQVWTIPASRMKAGIEHRIPLTTPMLDLLASIERHPHNPYIFVGMNPQKPISSMAMAMLIRRMDYAEITVHGFRSTFRDWAGECTSHPREVCEHALAHSLGRVEAAYSRGTLFDKRRRLMDDWTAYATTAPSNIIQFKKEA